MMIGFNRMVDGISDLTGEIRAGVSLTRDRLIRHHSEKATKAPTTQLEHEYLLIRSADCDHVNYTVYGGQSVYLEGRRRRLQARSEDELRFLPSGNGIDFRRSAPGFGNAKLARILSPEELRLITTRRSGRSSLRVSGTGSAAPAARTKRS
uniref:Uncharacterized protein n=1 Tax=Hyaloperonospora arabidopsidis (strain Emoy2) TaxID=559515 RepID=M4BP98_HYAAE